MAAGTYRHRITLYAPAPTVETAFGRKPTATEAALEIWALVEQPAAKTFFADGKLSVQQPYRITLRYVNEPAVGYAKRVEWEGKRITIYSITTDAKKTVTTLLGYAE